QRHEPAEQLHAAGTARRVEHERLRLELLQLRRRRRRLRGDLRAVRTRVPRAIELLLALRAELLLEDPEARRANRRVRARRARRSSARCPWRHPRWHSRRHSRWHSRRHSWLLHVLGSLLITLLIPLRLLLPRRQLLLP